MKATAPSQGLALHKPMDKIQIAISDVPYRSALAQMLAENAPCEVSCVDSPDPGDGGVMVVDAKHLGQLALPIRSPERIVLIAPNDPECLAQAWDAGVNSVVYDRDPLTTAVLAVLAARLRATKAIRGGERQHASLPPPAK